jgi:hypothetical protein
MEVDYTQDTNEKELKLYRTYMNSKIDIFQGNEDYVFRNENVNQGYMGSFEHRQMQNNSAKILTNASNMLVYTLAKNLGNLEKSQKELRKVFYFDREAEKENSVHNIAKEHKEFKKKIMRKKLQKDQEYLTLCEFINNSRFHDIMMTNLNFLRYILSHKYLVYHPRYEEINEKYRKLLCPMFRSSLQAGSEPQSQINSQQDEEDEDEEEEVKDEEMDSDMEEDN